MSGPPSVEQKLEARTRPIGEGLEVRRVLPATERRMVGPFIFFDHLGPFSLAPERGVDVRPHPHLGLATMTYLFEGELLHRDSLGTEQLIRPGAVNWMTAGRGIVHSERSPAAERKAGPRLHGLQLWTALPLALENGAPSFQHVGEGDIPELGLGGARVRVVAGSAYGAASPVKTSSPLFYVDAQMTRGAELGVPEEFPERAAYLVEGSLVAGGIPYRPGTMIVFQRGMPARLEAMESSRIVLLGGAPLDGDRHIWWNFVSSQRETIEEAGRAWSRREFPLIPGDEEEFVPLPDRIGRIR